MDAIHVSATICLTLTFYQYGGVALAWSGCRQRRSAMPAPAEAPGISLIRPLKGVESHSHETLEANFSLEYPEYEILFCVAQVSDPIIPLVEAAIAAHLHRPARLLVGEARLNANPKLNNMAKAWEAARYELLCFADSNLLLPRDYLQRVLSVYGPDVGAVSAPPIGVGADNWASEIECAFLNTLQARWLYGVDLLNAGFVQGKTMFFHRSLLGPRGLAALASETAEDSALTKLVRAAGLRVRAATPPFPQPISGRTLRAVWLRQLRWARIRRTTFPLLFLVEVMLGFAPALAAGLIALALSPLAWAWPIFVVGFLAVWLLPEFLLARRAGWPASPRALACCVLRDAMIPVLWCAALAAADFTWQGASLRADDASADGKSASARGSRPVSRWLMARLRGGLRRA